MTFTPTAFERKLEDGLYALGFTLGNKDFADSVLAAHEARPVHLDDLNTLTLVDNAVRHMSGEAIGNGDETEGVPFAVRARDARYGPLRVVYTTELSLPVSEARALSRGEIEQRIEDALRKQKSVYENVQVFADASVPGPMSVVERLQGKTPRMVIEPQEKICLTTYPFTKYDLIFDNAYVCDQENYDDNKMVSQVLQQLRKLTRK